MIRHCVFVKFAPEVSPSTKQSLYGKLAQLVERIPGMISFHAGPNVSPKEKASHQFKEGFIVDFQNRAACDAYAQDDRHQVLGAELLSLLADPETDYLVFDLEY